MKQMILLLAVMVMPSCLRAQSDTLSNKQIQINTSDSLQLTLPEVMVKGEHPIVQIDGSKLIFDMPQLMEGKPLDNAFDALKELPGVTTTDDDVQLGGQSVPIILNGKLTSMTRQQLITLLKSTPASRLQHAEVMLAAPAKYQVRGALLNLVLNKATDGDTALQGELYAKAETEHEASFNERATLLYRQGKLSVDALYSINHGKGYHTTHQTGLHTLNDGTQHPIDTYNVTQSDARPTHDYRIGLDYDFSDQHQLSLAYTGNNSGGNYQSHMTGMQQSAIANAKKDILHNGHIDYTLPFGLNIGADLTYYESNHSQDLGSNLCGSQLDFFTQNQQRINRTKYFLRQEHTLKKKWSLNYGATYTYVIDHSRQHYTATGSTLQSDLPDDLLSRNTEKTLNLYAGASHTFSTHLSAEVSLAAEHYRTPVWNDWDFFPTLSLSFTPQAQCIWQLSLSSDKRYPDYWAVQNATTYYGGAYEEILGNPLLKPSKTFSTSISHILKGKYIFRTWFTYQKDYFMQTMYQSPERFNEIAQFNNFDFHQQAGLMASLPLNFSWWFTIRLNLISVWMREKDSDYYTCPFNRDIAYGMATSSTTLRFSRRHDLSLILYGFIRSKAIQGTMDLPASGNLDLTLRYAFAHSHAVLTAYCQDLFQTRSISPTITWAHQRLRTDFSCYRVAGITFTYKFGGYKEKKYKEVDTSRMRK